MSHNASVCFIDAKRKRERDEQKVIRMGDLIVDKMHRNGSCSDDDLLQAGFTSDEIQELGASAKRYAARQMDEGGHAT